MEEVRSLVEQVGSLVEEVRSLVEEVGYLVEMMEGCGSGERLEKFPPIK